MHRVSKIAGHLQLQDAKAAGAAAAAAGAGAGAAAAATVAPAPTHGNAKYTKKDAPSEDEIYQLLAKTTGTKSLKGKTLFISGASRGIGLAIGLRAARDGANVIIGAKTATPHARLPGTIHSAADEIRAAGGRALAVECDIRFEDQVKKAVEAGVKEFGGIDICVNNASAISLTQTEDTDMKKFDLMHGINARGTFLVSKCCIPYLKKSQNGMILNISPPLSMDARWFEPHLAYTWAKMGMSICAMGMAAELRSSGVAVNTLWPLTTIATAAVANLLGGDDMVRRSRTGDIMADAAHAIFTSDAKNVTGCYFIDEKVMRALGVKDFSKYAVTKGMPDNELALDFFV